MEWKEFIIELIKALAWPITIGVIVFYLRETIANLLPRISKLKHKDTEIEFAEAMGVIKERAENILIQDQDVIGELKTEKARLKRISGVVPRSALIQAWGLIDRQISDLLVLNNITPEGHSLRTSDVIDFLKSIGLTKNDVKTFLELRKIMKSVTGPSEFELSEEQVESYIELSVNIVLQLQKAGSNKALN